MTRFKALLVSTLFLLLLFGCSNEAMNKQVEFHMIASEKTLPANFDEIAFNRKTTPLFQYLVSKVIDPVDFEEKWNSYGFDNKIANVDFKEKGIFFIGVQESGSCPYKIRNIELSSDNKTLTVPLSEPDGACTADATPRTFVIQIDKEIAKNIEALVIVQDGVETSIAL